MRGPLDSLLQISVACKIPANRRILPKTHFSTFQDIYSGCCTVAAHVLETSAKRTELRFGILLTEEAPSTRNRGASTGSRLLQTPSWTHSRSARTWGPTRQG